MALAWMALAGGTAWGQQSSIVWEGEELPAEGGEFYLYNKGGGGFLVGGNDYGPIFPSGNVEFCVHWSPTGRDTR